MKLFRLGSNYVPIPSSSGYFFILEVLRCVPSALKFSVWGRGGVLIKSTIVRFLLLGIYLRTGG